MNKYNVRCPGCGELLLDYEYEGRTVLIHPGSSPRSVAVSLPTQACVAIPATYVTFAPCGHCCPDSFELCPQCDEGRPTSDSCSSRGS